MILQDNITFGYNISQAIATVAQMVRYAALTHPTIVKNLEENSVSL
ncbi:MAG: hypothetical protein F6K41_22915 [Symploca sp. SIO3E6]|nr:hypothetical protein [Caldora sp. SIO3E6]